MPSVASHWACPFLWPGLNFTGYKGDQRVGNGPWYWAIRQGHQLSAGVSGCLPEDSKTPRVCRAMTRHSTCAWSPRTTILRLKVHFNRIPCENHKLGCTFFPSQKNHFTHILDTQMLSFFSVILFYTILSTYSIIFNMFEIFKIKINFFCHAQIKKT